MFTNTTIGTYELTRDNVSVKIVRESKTYHLYVKEQNDEDFKIYTKADGVVRDFQVLDHAKTQALRSIEYAINGRPERKKKDEILVETVDDKRYVTLNGVRYIAVDDIKKK